VLYPLMVRDFLDRAEHVYPDQVAIVDEPEQPAPSLGEITYREMAALAGFKCPKRVEFVTELPRTATGKLQKFKLREPFWAGRTRQVG